MKDIFRQECNDCSKEFLLKYNKDGSYDYITEPCECESSFSPSEGELSISEWLGMA